MQNQFGSIFHLLIIAIFLLGLGGCGYKADPFYNEQKIENESQVIFTQREVNTENNESK